MFYCTDRSRTLGAHTSQKRKGTSSKQCRNINCTWSTPSTHAVKSRTCIEYQSFQQLYQVILFNMWVPKHDREEKSINLRKSIRGNDQEKKEREKIWNKKENQSNKQRWLIEVGWNWNTITRSLACPEDSVLASSFWWLLNIENKREREKSIFQDKDLLLLYDASARISCKAFFYSILFNLKRDKFL